MPPTTRSQVLPFPAQSGLGSKEWFISQADWAAEIRKQKLTTWRLSAKAYAGKLQPPRPEGVRVNIEFEKTEQKKPQLFFQLPALKLRAAPRTQRDAQQGADLKKAIAVFREVLTRLAGKKGANTKALMDQLLFDVLCPSGIAFAKVGYERYEDGVIPIQVGTQPDPNFTQPGAVLGISLPAPMVPVYNDAPNVVAERYFASRISPARALIPAEFTGSDYDDADWLGHDFPISDEAVAANDWRSTDARGGSYESDDDDRIVPLEKSGQRTGQKRCRELFYYASRFDPRVKHPNKIRRLVIVDGVVVVHEDFRDQRFDQHGRFSMGLRTLPIKVLTLRYVSDDPYPPSDCAITKTHAEELSEFRTQQIIHRRRAVPLRWVDVNGVLDEAVKTAIKKGEYYDIIPTDGKGDDLVGELTRPAFPQENNQSQDYVMNDINRMWALGANQSGVTEKGSATATEIGSISSATATRLGGERVAVTAFWLGIMEALGALVQLYADQQDYVEIVGADGAKLIEAWDKTSFPGEYLYDIVPNSMVQPDAASDRDLALNYMNLVINNPLSNQTEILRDVAEAFGRDPDRMVQQPQAPPPEKPKINVAINGKDLDPMSPQYPNVISLLHAAGIPDTVTLSPAAAGVPGAPGADAPAAVPAAPIGPAPVVDRERLRMAETDAHDHRGGLVGVGGR